PLPGTPPWLRLPSAALSGCPRPPCDARRSWGTAPLGFANPRRIFRNLSAFDPVRPGHKGETGRGSPTSKPDVAHPARLEGPPDSDKQGPDRTHLWQKVEGLSELTTLPSAVPITDKHQRDRG